MASRKHRPKDLVVEVSDPHREVLSHPELVFLASLSLHLCRRIGMFSFMG